MTPTNKTIFEPAATLYLIFSDTSVDEKVLLAPVPGVMAPKEILGKKNPITSKRAQIPAETIQKKRSLWILTVTESNAELGRRSRAGRKEPDDGVCVHGRRSKCNERRESIERGIGS